MYVGATIKAYGAPRTVNISNDKRVTTMKKFLVALAISLGVVATVPLSGATVSAAPQPKVDVSGTVTIDGKTVKGAKVVVQCGSTVKRDTADANGNYFVQFKKAQCPTGSTITVIAHKGSKGGSTTATSEADGSTTANVTVSTTAVPEFSPAAGVGAAAVVGGGLVVMRRRQLGQQA